MSTVHSIGCPMPAPAPAAAMYEHTQQQIELIRSLLVTVQHFFGGFNRLFENVTDPRHPAYITYPLPCVLATGVFMFLLRLGARRQVNLMLRQNGPSSAKFQAIFDVQTCPHGDTIDQACSRLSVTEVQDVVTGTVRTLIRRKVLYPYRLRGRYFLVAVDGTGVLTFPERHCPHCLTTTRNGHTTYYHPVLEAKLVTRDGCQEPDVDVPPMFTKNAPLMFTKNVPGMFTKNAPPVFGQNVPRMFTRMDHLLRACPCRVQDRL